jgi:PAS domain S-box-containing protein
VPGSLAGAGARRRRLRPVDEIVGDNAEWLAALRPRRVLSRYALGIVLVAAALGLRLLLAPLTGAGAPFVIFFGAVLITGLLAGTGPGLLCLALGVPIATGLFVLPQGYPLRQALFQALLYTLDGLIILLLTWLIERWANRLRLANEQLRDATVERDAALEWTREAIELAPDAYFLADLSARFIDVNRAGCRLLGFERSELLGMSIFDLIQADAAARLEAQKTALLVPGTVLTNEWSLKRKDGTFVPVEVSANILRDGRWQAFIRDITERRKASKEREDALALEHAARQQAEAANAQLRESEERFRLTIDEAPIGMALVALDGRFLRVNRVLCEITGYAADELVRLTFQDITHPEDLAKDVELARRLAAGDIPRYQLEKRYVRKDRSVIVVMLSGSVVRAPDGTARYFIAQVEDVTARKRAEEALRLSEAKFSGIVSIAVDAIISVDEQQHITIFNEGAEQIFGYSKAEMLGTELERLIPERFRAAHRAHFAAFASGSERARPMAGRQDIFGLRKNGEEFPAEASISRVGVDGTAVFSVVLRDITARKQVEEALRRAVAARDEMVGVVAHDLRNPLGTIMSAASLLESPAREGAGRSGDPRQIIDRSARRMNRLIQDLLDVTRAEAGQLTVEHATICTRDLIREVIDAQRPLAASSGVEIEGSVADEVPAIRGDHDRLLRVFENLIGNAIKFTPAGGKVIVGATADGTFVRFSVADTGAGIPSENLPHIFDRFWQGATRQRRQGAGLGLPIVRGIVEAHAGRIWATSVVGRGSTFFFTVPAAPARGEASCRHDATLSPSSPQLQEDAK